MVGKTRAWQPLNVPLAKPVSTLVMPCGKLKLAGNDVRLVQFRNILLAKPVPTLVMPGGKLKFSGNDVRLEQPLNIS